MPGTSRPTVRPKVDAQLVLPKEQVGLFTIVTYSFFALVLAPYAAYLHDRQAGLVFVRRSRIKPLAVWTFRRLR